MTTSTDHAVPDPAVEPTLSVPRAARVLGIDRRTAYTAIEDGTFPAHTIRVGRRFLVSTASLRRVLDLDVPEVS